MDSQRLRGGHSKMIETVWGHRRGSISLDGIQATTPNTLLYRSIYLLVKQNGDLPDRAHSASLLAINDNFLGRALLPRILRLLLAYL